jgi:hypothetical protein
MVHFTSVIEPGQSAEEVLRPAVGALLNDQVFEEEHRLRASDNGNPCIISAVFFTLEQRAVEEKCSAQLPSNLVVCQEFAQPSSAWVGLRREREREVRVHGFLRMSVIVSLRARFFSRTFVTLFHLFAHVVVLKCPSRGRRALQAAVP